MMNKRSLSTLSIPTHTLTLAFSLCLYTGCDGTAGSNSAGERTLDSCTTQIAADAPAFFKKYFQCVTIAMKGQSVAIDSIGLPPHKSYYYGTGSPNYTDFDTSRGSMYRANPNKLAMKNVHIEVPLNPTPKGITVTSSMVDLMANTSVDEYRLGTVGMALDSVMLFNATAAPGDNIEMEKYTFDNYEAHPSPNSEYHYHAASPGPLEVLQKKGLVTTSKPGSASIELYGIMCDGTVLLGCTELNGSAPNSGDFDAQNGHTHDIVDGDGSTAFAKRYHTHICADKFPKHKFTPEIQFHTTCVNR